MRPSLQHPHDLQNQRQERPVMHYYYYSRSREAQRASRCVCGHMHENLMQFIFFNRSNMGFSGDTFSARAPKLCVERSHVDKTGAVYLRRQLMTDQGRKYHFEIELETAIVHVQRQPHRDRARDCNCPCAKTVLVAIHPATFR